MIRGSFFLVKNTGKNIIITCSISMLSFRILILRDYATAAPYVKIAMNPTTVDYPSGVAHKDAIYFSMHKFVGGVQTPGILCR